MSEPWVKKLKRLVTKYMYCRYYLFEVFFNIILFLDFLFLGDVQRVDKNKLCNMSLAGNPFYPIEKHVSISYVRSPEDSR